MASQGNDSDSGYGTTFSDNDDAIEGNVKSGKSAFKKKSTVYKLTGPVLPKNNITSRLEAHSIRSAMLANKYPSADDLGIRIAVRDANREVNSETRSAFVKDDAARRAEIIKLFEEWERYNPPDTRVRFSEDPPKVGTAKRDSMGIEPVTVDQDRREKAQDVANNVANILFELLKDIPADQVNRKMDEIIANASPVNTNLKNPNELTSRKINHLYNADLFEKAVNMAFDRINGYRLRLDVRAFKYTKDIINSIKDRLYSWVFGGASVGGYSSIKTQTKRRINNKKRSKKSKRSIKRIRSNKSKKRI
jgi:hypothetical protein